MFNALKSKLGLTNKLIIGAPVEGNVVAVSEVSDPTFGEEILGKGVAIHPTMGRVVAPVDGTVSILFETKHAVSIVSDQGTEILIHVGLDTVALKGEHFTAFAKAGDKVKKGDLLLEFDMEKIKEAGYQVITPVVICNTADYKEVKPITGMHAAVTEDIMELTK